MDPILHWYWQPKTSMRLLPGLSMTFREASPYFKGGPFSQVEPEIHSWKAIKKSHWKGMVKLGGIGFEFPKAGNYDIYGVRVKRSR